MPQPIRRTIGAPLLVTFFAITAAACTSSGAATPPLAGTPAAASTAPAASAPVPSESMMEHSPMPSESMVDHSPAATASTPVSVGSFHAVDGTASGTAALFHKPDGSFVITFETFSTPTASHIDVILVPNHDVTKDGEIDRTTIVDLGPLTGTAGMQDYAVPASADAMTYHTVVLWDTEMTHAVAAAPLAPTP